MKLILFNTEMIRAILEGRKTVTRRVVRLKYSDTHLEMFTNKYGTRLIEKQNFEPGVTIVKNPDGRTMRKLLACMEKTPPCRPGDILYVREKWQYAYELDGNDQAIEGTGRYLYAADENNPSCSYWVMPDGTHRGSMPWRPSIHMPREAARLFLRVTDVRVERLQEITDDELVCDFGICQEAIQAVGRDALAIPFWDSTIKNPADRALYGWAANPWVWVIAFERCEKQEENK